MRNGSRDPDTGYAGTGRTGPSHRWLGLALALGLLAGACGGDPLVGSGSDPLDPALVIGTYDPTTLSFDVEGSTFGEYDLLAGLPDEEPPRLIIGSDGVAQLVFLNPATGRLETGEGSIRMLADGLRIVFVTAEIPGRLLLPQSLTLLYDETSGTLSYSAETQVPLARLVALVPELADEPLSDPVGGLLTVEFTPR